MFSMPPLLDESDNRIVPVCFKCCTASDQKRYWKNPSIYKVPASITKLNSKAYRPQVVSFGPYHHGEDHLQPMEKHKVHARLHFLERSRKSEKSFRDSLREVAQDLEESYIALDQKWKEGTGDQFLNLMIRDGCFMLEIMRTTVGEMWDYAPNDPVFNIERQKYITPYIRQDMLMLENQLPMQVLHRLVALENNGKERDGYINRLILSFYSLDKGMKGMCRCLHEKEICRCPHEKEMGRCLHVVDVVRKGLLMKPEEVQPKPEKEGSPAGNEIIWSATELSEAGIRFKKSKTNSLKDISFSEGVLRLPLIRVDNATKAMFLNIIAFERLHIGARTEVTSYVTFMDNIINDKQDVALLRAQGIIQNASGSVKEVANLFDSLCREVTLASSSSLDAVQKEISTYCQKPWNRWRANLNRTYFRSPWTLLSLIAAIFLFALSRWTILSLIAAIFLFALTIIQTVYAVQKYCEKRWNRWRANLNHTSPWTILSLIAAVFLLALNIIQTVYAVLS